MQAGDWVSVAEAADVIGVTAKRVYALIAAGRLKPARVGNQYLLLRAEVEAFAKLPRKSGRPTSKKPRKKK